MSPTAANRPTRRSDASENRDKILVAARAAFAEETAEVSMAEVSRRAGVGMATLYRNFADRRALLEAIYADEVDDLCRAALVVDGDTAGARLENWLRAFFDFALSKRPVAALLIAQTDRANPVFDTSRDRVIAAGLLLLATAQADGEVRPDLTIEQVLDLVRAVAAISTDPAYVAPILQSVLDGLGSHSRP